MRITFLLTQSLESPSGGGRYLPLARCLAELGHRVTILALHHDYAHAKPRRFVQDNVRIHYVGQMHVRKVASQKLYYSPLALLWVAAMATLRLTWTALLTPADVVHVCKAQPMNGFAAWVVHRLRRVPIYLDSDDHEASNNRFSASWQQRLVAWFEDWLPSFSAGVTVNTTFIARRLQQRGYPANRIVLVPNAVDRERFALLEQPTVAKTLAKMRQSLHIQQFQRVVVYVGTISLVSHAIDLLLEAFADVVRQQPDALLLLVGGGEDLVQMKQLQHNLGLSDHVRFLGRVPPEKVPLYYRLAEVTVDPRRNSPAVASSLSLKVVESIVAGVPCVTTDVGDRRALVGATGLAVAPGDAQALAEAILLILNDPDIQNRMRQACRDSRDRYFWQRYIHTFTTVYNS